MKKLYSYKGACPCPLPRDMHKYDISDFVLAPEKPVAPDGHFVEWDGTNWAFRIANSAEIAFKWMDVREKRNRLIQESDVLILRFYENKQEVPEVLADYRQKLRDIPQNFDNPFFVEWPTFPTF